VDETFLTEIAYFIFAVKFTLKKRAKMKEMSFDAVIFDMDGVITRTAATHAAAWKKNV
jgi:hypothetical protein